MALSYESITLYGKVQDAIEISQTDGLYIQKNALAAFDVEQLTKVHATIGTGSPAIADWEEALAAYTMPNGQKADVYYADFIVDLAAANAAWRPGDVPDVLWDQVDANTQAIADHEERIVDLESA